ncbi:MAG: UDP-N-acetylglucosamine pyrophosphorylase [Oscillospiraceae bacterium]|nr:UDP-N-acetylglucosamine pyrophosphorylase [Oscillospiraceae bacterium]
MNREMTVEALYDLSHTAAAPLLAAVTYPWEALPRIKDFIRQTGATLPAEEYIAPKPGVWIHKSAAVAPSAYLGEDIIIYPGAEIRHCAFLRGPAIVGSGAVVGNSTELKNVILFDKVQVPHYNYVGDSILGFRAHMGAGSITSNVKSDSSLTAVSCRDADGTLRRIDTGLKKFGAMLGDMVEVGCNTVLNPATVVGKNSNIYPLSSVRGFIPAGSIYKRAGEIVAKN